MNSSDSKDLFKRINALSDNEKEWERLKAELKQKEIEVDQKLSVLNSKLKEEYNNKRKISEEIQYYRRILDYIPHIIMEASAEGMPEFMSKSFFSYTGLSHQDFPDKWQSIIHPDDVEQTRCLWRDCISKGENFKVEHRIKSKTGEYKWFLSKVTAVKKSGKILKWIATATDIDSERRTMDRLHESEEQFRFMAESIPHIVWTALPDGYEDFHNSRFSDYTGLSVEEATGSGWLKIVHPDDLANTLKVWKESLATGRPYKIEYRFRRHDGEFRWFLGRALPKKDSDGNIVKWFGTCTDIQDEKIATNRLRQAIEEATQSNNELSRVNNILNNFVYIAAHDLRSPVTNLMMIADLFKDEKDPAKKEELVGLISKSVSRLDKTIHGLVEVIDVESIELMVKPINFNDALAGVVADLSVVYPDIQKNIFSDFESCSSIDFVEPYLNSIMKNIISNAYKYKSDKRRLKIEVSTKREDDAVKLTITDNGVGFDSEKYKDLVFKPFKRLSHHGEGKGVGLFLVKSIIEKNGGSINVTSKPDIGTTFYITLKEYK